MGLRALNHKDIVQIIVISEGVSDWIKQPSQFAGNQIIGVL